MGRPRGIPSKFRLDLTGLIFNRLTGVKEIGVDKHQSTVWLFDCSCGNQHKAIGYLVKRGSIKSCGCWNSEVIAARNRAKAKNPLGSPLGVSPVEYFSWSLVKKRAKRYGREFSLNIHDYLNVISQNCHYCGCVPYHYTKKGCSVFVHNGIDRKDNNQGYTLDNIVPCCMGCNRIKKQRNYDDFVQR